MGERDSGEQGCAQTRRHAAQLYYSGCVIFRSVAFLQFDSVQPALRGRGDPMGCGPIFCSPAFRFLAASRHRRGAAFFIPPAFWLNLHLRAGKSLETGIFPP